MRQIHTSHSRALRPLFSAVVVVIAIGTSGCHFFSRKHSVYSQSAETRPLEVPPDLDRPNTEGAIPVPSADTSSVTRSSMPSASRAAMPAGSQNNASGFTLPGDRDDVFNKVGTALTATDGLTIVSKAQLLGTYDVSYQGANFLVRVSKVDAGVYVSAIDPRGLPASNDAATRLIASLKASLAAS